MCLRDLANKMIGETNYRARQSFAVLVDEIAPNLQPVKFLNDRTSCRIKKRSYSTVKPVQNNQPISKETLKLKMLVEYSRHIHTFKALVKRRMIVDDS